MIGIKQFVVIHVLYDVGKARLIVTYALRSDCKTGFVVTYALLNNSNAQKNVIQASFGNIKPPKYN